MSGIEAVGIVLGAFPLLVSCFEHYEDVRTVAGTFYKIRRAHKKDLGRIKDCQLRFKLNLKELLLPLLVDDIVSRLEYEQLLADPGGSCWKDSDVTEALQGRMKECHERYFEILGDMEETMAALCRATKVDDLKFQAMVQDRSTSAITATQKAKATLMIRAQTSFQAKRFNYAMTGTRRDNLIDEIEGYNKTLEDVLSANDRISALTQQSTSEVSKPRIPKHLLQFWRHANCIFRLLKEAWTCQCQGVHCMKLWLKQKSTSSIDLDIALQFCHGPRSVQIKLADTASPGQAYDPSVPMRFPLRPLGKAPSITVQRSSTFATTITSSSQGVSSMRTATKVTCFASSASTIVQSHSELKDAGVCQTIKSALPTTKDAYGIMTDHDSDRQYTVTEIGPSPPLTGTDDVTLSDVLESKALTTLTRVQRYSLAATLASSVLQYEATPWVRSWASNAVHFPKDIASTHPGIAPQEQPFLLTALTPAPPSTEDSFKALGTLLLELCFGKTLDEHSIWQQPAFSAAKTNPMLRQFVATEWLKEADGEAGEQFASAIRWCLQQAPALLNDDKWRTDFAQQVVWPLTQCHESMQPRKSTP
ncbi:hypothetical protein LTR95_016434 [Oleoguttula sp. CCFEE 5521]